MIYLSDFQMLKYDKKLFEKAKKIIHQYAILPSIWGFRINKNLSRFRYTIHKKTLLQPIKASSPIRLSPSWLRQQLTLDSLLFVR